MWKISHLICSLSPISVGFSNEMTILHMLMQNQNHQACLTSRSIHIYIYRCWYTNNCLMWRESREVRLITHHPRHHHHHHHHRMFSLFVVLLQTFIIFKWIHSVISRPRYPTCERWGPLTKGNKCGEAFLNHCVIIIMYQAHNHSHTYARIFSFYICM